MDAVVAYQQTAAIKSAVELDLFSEIARPKADIVSARSYPAEQCPAG
jgi:hypothetical protein